MNKRQLVDIQYLNDLNNIFFVILDRMVGAFLWIL